MRSVLRPVPAAIVMPGIMMLPLVPTSPRVDRLTRRAVDGSRWVGKHIDQTAQFEVDKKYVASDVPTITNLLSSYEWHPSADLVFEDIQLGARDFLKAGILDKRTDPDDLAKRAYVDIFRQVANA